MSFLSTNELLDALSILARFPLEESNWTEKPDKKITGFNDWELRVSHVLAARVAVAKAAEDQRTKTGLIAKLREAIATNYMDGTARRALERLTDELEQATGAQP